MLNFYNHWALSYEISEMVDILNIVSNPIFDDRIIKFEFYPYNPYVNNTSGHSDDIRIPIQQQDIHAYPRRVEVFFMSKVDWCQKK